MSPRQILSSTSTRAHVHLTSNSREGLVIYQSIVNASCEPFRHLHSGQPRSQPQTTPSSSKRGWRFHNAQDRPKAISPLCRPMSARAGTSHFQTTNRSTHLRSTRLLPKHHLRFDGSISIETIDLLKDLLVEDDLTQGFPISQTRHANKAERMLNNG